MRIKDPGSGMQKIKIGDQGSRMQKILIRDLGWEKFGSGIPYQKNWKFRRQIC
jgi:hypothetical protein